MFSKYLELTKESQAYKKTLKKRINSFLNDYDYYNYYRVKIDSDKIRLVGFGDNPIDYLHISMFEDLFDVKLAFWSKSYITNISLECHVDVGIGEYIKFEYIFK